MNSGNTKPFPHPRCENTFSRIRDYPYQERKAKRLERVVELAVDYSVPRINDFVVRVVEMQASAEIRTIYSVVPSSK